MECIKGKWYGSCHECGHSFEWPANGEDGPLVFCIGSGDLMPKYQCGCGYLIPQCEHNRAKPADFAAIAPRKRRTTPAE